MKVKLINLKNSERSLVKVLKTDLPIKLAYRLSKLVKVVQNELEDIEGIRIGLVKKYGEELKDEKEKYNFTNENAKAFEKEFESLLEEEIEIDCTPISAEDMGDDIKLSALDISLLEIFIKF